MIAGRRGTTKTLYTVMRRTRYEGVDHQLIVHNHLVDALQQSRSRATGRVRFYQTWISFPTRYGGRS